MTQKILLIGSPGITKMELILLQLKEKYGDDIIVYTPEEAKAQGLDMKEFYDMGDVPMNPTLKLEDLVMKLEAPKNFVEEVRILSIHKQESKIEKRKRHRHLSNKHKF